MDQIKEAFAKVKSDMDSLKEDISHLKESLKETKETIVRIFQLYEKLSQIKEKASNFLQGSDNLNTSSTISYLPKHPNTFPTHNSTDRQQTDNTPAHNSAHLSLFKPQKGEIYDSSTGNGGVPADRQTTDRQQTDTPAHSLSIQKPSKVPKTDHLLILDESAKEIRSQFRKLTDQEFKVFLTIGQLEESQNAVDYRILSEKLSLTESSIRDYIQRIIKKGIPVEKIKVNNKNINLKISEKLRKIATLPYIMELRNLDNSKTLSDF